MEPPKDGFAQVPTRNIKIWLQYSRGANYVILIKNLDSNWGKDLDSRKSMVGFSFLLENGVTNWANKKQTTIAFFSTKEAREACS